ncbi:MAG TPA: RluA family pseudouridine synthase, partial [Blastocatellia bacterium]|nr:RluA family pseudouridine synthase [Blastocatellia bacterium]
RSKALSAIERGKVFVNDVEQTVADAARRLQAGETVRLWMDRPGSAERRYSERREAGLHLLYEDSSLLVINKPAGLLTVPLPSQPAEPSLVDQLKHHLRSHKKMEPLVVHRIDRDTSGIVIFAKNHEAQRKLQDQFEQRKAERVYLALVYGHPKPESGTWRDYLLWNQDSLKQQPAERRDRNAKEAVCRYRTLEKFPGAALIEVSLVTGKRNQIRVQAALRGHPLVGEKKYVYDPAPQPRIEFARQALHAHRLAFKHPVNQRPMNFEAQAPEDFQSLLETLKTRK